MASPHPATVNTATPPSNNDTPAQPDPEDEDEEDFENNEENREDENEEDEDADVMAQMGFTAFGSKPKPKKKNKEKDKDTSPPLKKVKVGATGGNALPLGRDRERDTNRDRGSVATPLPLPPRPPPPPTPFNDPINKAAGVDNPPAYNHSTSSTSANAASNHRAEGEVRREGGKSPNGGWDWAALRRGVRDENGDLAFYDRGFVEDPWVGLRGGGKSEGIS